jgi:hypothetical protein
MKQVTVFGLFCLLIILVAQNGCTKKEPPSADNETTNEISSESHQPEQVKVVSNSIGMKLVYIPAGSFMMGSPSNEDGRDEDEGPQHQVRISEGFWMGQTEVTPGPGPDGTTFRSLPTILLYLQVGMMRSSFAGS